MRPSWKLLYAMLWFWGTAEGAVERITLSPDGKGFIKSPSGDVFVPWGVNYDHDASGRLIEDYWETDWEAVAGDFREIRALNANVVRVHLQFGRFMNSPTEPNAGALDRLEKLLRLAEDTGVYLDLTGLGCYHKQDVPDWYDQLDEDRRWAAQCRFWEAVAERCRESGAVFCYDLMNEPVVAVGDGPQEWLGPAFAGKHFVQRITLKQGDRPREEIARAWIRRLVSAIRRRDSHTLITVGLVDWSLDRPGLRSGFVPEKACSELDFISVHLYPEHGKTEEALRTLEGFDIGKPLVIEEIYPLKAGPKETLDFIRQSRIHADGWISFYWGRTLEEMTPASSLGEAIQADWLRRFREFSPTGLKEPDRR